MANYLVAIYIFNLYKVLIILANELLYLSAIFEDGEFIVLYININSQFRTSS